MQFFCFSFQIQVESLSKTGFLYNLSLRFTFSITYTRLMNAVFCFSFQIQVESLSKTGFLYNLSLRFTFSITYTPLLEVGSVDCCSSFSLQITPRDSGVCRINYFELEGSDHAAWRLGYNAWMVPRSLLRNNGASWEVQSKVHQQNGTGRIGGK